MAGQKFFNKEAVNLFPKKLTYLFELDFVNQWYGIKLASWSFK